MANERDLLGSLLTAAPTRRGFLRLAGATAAFSALAQLPVLPAAAACAPDSGDRFFDDAETEILSQLMQRMVETGLPNAPQVRDTRAVATVDAVCRGLDPAVSGLLPLALRAVDWGPVFFELRPARFTRLSPGEQDASLRGWMTSRFQLRRTAFLGLRNLCFLGWYSQPESWSLIGYQGPLLRRPTDGRVPA